MKTYHFKNNNPMKNNNFYKWMVSRPHLEKRRKKLFKKWFDSKFENQNARAKYDAFLKRVTTIYENKYSGELLQLELKTAA